MSEPIWSPSSERIAQANLTRFMAFANDRHGLQLADYPGLYRWSIEVPEEFWPAVWEFCGIVAHTPWRIVLEHPRRMPGARWFVGSRLNFAENLLRYRDEHPALVFRDEAGRRRELSYRQLYERTAATAAGLSRLGVGRGDRIAAFLPNLPEAVIAMLASSSIGAVWSSCSPDFGPQGVLDRFGQIEPKVLFVADGYRYGGRRFDSLEAVAGLVESLPHTRHVVVVPNLAEHPDLSAVRRALPLAELLEEPAGELAFEPLPFEQPLFVLYSSGTTGMPKCIVHGAGGTLLQHQKEHVLHTDLRRDDRLFYFTTCGWMMWNWLVSGLAVGATVVLYDGAPMHPAADTLWQIAEEERLTVFGTSARYLAAIEKAGVRPAADYDLSGLRAVLSTGSPLAPESFDYVYREIGQDLQLASISGGTDIISCFGLGNPIAPVYRGELQCRGLGMRVEIYDEAGCPVRGRKGELVCTAAFPSMPLGFWNDAAGDKYRGAYFERFPGVWCHGDYAELTEHDGLIIYGRSDAVLNPGGVRIGTAEIYRQVEKLDEVLESIAVGQDWRGDSRIVLFVKLRPDTKLDEALQERIRTMIRANTTPRHVPAKIIAVPDIPRTISGKIVELAVSNVIHGRLVRNIEALANPEALEHFRDLPELES